MGKWSTDVFLDRLRQQGDPQADEAVARLIAAGGTQAVGPIFKLLAANDTPLPPGAPEPLVQFMATSAGLPPGIDMARLQRGGDVFLRNALPAVVVLLASSLPRGYAAPCLCEILTISGDLERHPFNRLMGVVQLLVNISDENAFEPGGRAVVTARKLRLLHAGIRVLTARYRPHYHASFGVPVNHEDMLATIMGFSYLVVDGLQRLGRAVPPSEAEDLYYLWYTFALLMGIHPDGQPHDHSLIPATVDEAAEFYASYVRRNNTMPDRNRAGVVLTQDNLRMMTALLPWSVRLMGLGFAPRMFMTELMTPEELARVGMKPQPGHRVLERILASILRLSQKEGERHAFAARLGRHLLQGMVDVDRHGHVAFAIPFSRVDLRGRGFE